MSIITAMSCCLFTHQIYVLCHRPAACKLNKNSQFSVLNLNFYFKLKTHTVWFDFTTTTLWVCLIWTFYFLSLKCVCVSLKFAFRIKKRTFFLIDSFSYQFGQCITCLLKEVMGDGGCVFVIIQQKKKNLLGFTTTINREKKV